MYSTDLTEVIACRGHLRSEGPGNEKNYKILNMQRNVQIEDIVSLIRNFDFRFEFSDKRQKKKNKKTYVAHPIQANFILWTSVIDYVFIKINTFSRFINKYNLYENDFCNTKAQ